MTAEHATIAERLEQRADQATLIEDIALFRRAAELIVDAGLEADEAPGADARRKAAETWLLHLLGEHDAHLPSKAFRALVDALAQGHPERLDLPGRAPAAPSASAASAA